jgi:putative amidoligase enzyme
MYSALARIRHSVARQADLMGKSGAWARVSSNLEDSRYVGIFCGQLASLYPLSVLSGDSEIRFSGVTRLGNLALDINHCRRIQLTSAPGQMGRGYRRALSTFAQPPRPLNHQGEPRKVGVELELSGLELSRLPALVREVLGGEEVPRSTFSSLLLNLNTKPPGTKQDGQT